MTISPSAIQELIQCDTAMATRYQLVISYISMKWTIWLTHNTVKTTPKLVKSPASLRNHPICLDSKAAGTQNDGTYWDPVHLCGCNEILIGILLWISKFPTTHWVIFCFIGNQTWSRQIFRSILWHFPGKAMINFVGWAPHHVFCCSTKQHTQTLKGEVYLQIYYKNTPFR